MSNFESNVQYIKYLVNKEVATRFFQGKLEHNMDSLRDIRNAISLRTGFVWYWNLPKMTES